MTLTEKHNQRKEQIEQAIDNWIDEVKTDLTDLLKQDKIQTITYEIGNTSKEVKIGLRLIEELYLSDYEDALGICLDEEDDVCVVTNNIYNEIETKYIKVFPDHNIIKILSYIDWESVK